jgi:hypothetical protein
MIGTLSLAPLEEFLAIIRRDLAAEDARILEPGAPPQNEGAVTERALPGDHRLVVKFATTPPDLDARLRRLDMLVDSFQSMLATELTGAPFGRPSPARSLHDELAALAKRAGAVDALVIDARSPVVWGAAVEEHIEPPETAELPSVPPPEPSGVIDAPREKEAIIRVVKPPVRRLRAAPGRKTLGKSEPAEPKSAVKPDRLGHIHRVPDPEPEPTGRDPASDRAIQAVRALPEMATLHKGGHIHESASQPDFGYVARSFAGIYVLVLVFREPFDELRAKRATVHALPIIERLVLALPPLDPAPMAGAMALPRRRRRR